MYGDVLGWLSDCAVDFVVTGGYAVRFYGYERPVYDLDIVVEREPRAAARTMQCLLQIGFYPTIPLQISEAVVLTFCDARARRLDVNAVYVPPFGELLARATCGRIEGHPVRVIALPDLIEVKRRRARPYDVEDLRHLAGAAPTHNS